MKKKISELYQDGLIKNTSIVNALVFSVFIIVLLFRWNSLELELPLFYSLPRSEEQLGTPIMLLILPFSSVVIYLVNFLIALKLYPQEKLSAYLLFLAGTITSFLLLVTFSKIIFLIS